MLKVVGSAHSWSQNLHTEREGEDLRAVELRATAAEPDPGAS